MRYIPHTENDIREMLKAVGVEKTEDLFDTIPKKLRLNRPLDLPEALDELSLFNCLSDLATNNNPSPDRLISFLGAGAYAHHIPAAVDAMLGRGEFFTAYTPYQPEVSQGTLQAIFEYQSMMASLTGTEVVNASMYDGPSATAEALLMAKRIKKKRPRTLLSTAVHPEVRQVCDTYLSDQSSLPESVKFSSDGRTDLTDLVSRLDSQVAAVVIQQPNFFGCLEDLPRIAEITHQAGALLVVVVLEPVSLGILEAPGKLGADIVTGEGMGFGTGINFGGPGLGIFGTSMENAWQMPGRLVGQTEDHQGQRGFVLTLATREQHIRRARATSNICSNEGLCALAATIHLSLLGWTGLRELAQTNAANARVAKQRLTQVKGVSLAFSSPVFNEFVLRIHKGINPLMAHLIGQRILGGVPLGRFYPDMEDCMLVCVTEQNTAKEVELFASALTQFEEK